MRRLGSLVMRAAEASRVPAGAALAVDRERFAELVTARARRPSAHHDRPRRSDRDSRRRASARRSSSPPVRSPRTRCRPTSRAWSAPTHLYFYDAISPIVLAETIDRVEGVPRSRGGIAACGRRASRPATRRRAAHAGRRWRGRLPELSADARGVRAVLRRARARRVGDGPRLRQGAVLRGLPADRGDGAPRRRHAAVRADEAGRARRSAHRDASRTPPCSCGRTIWPAITSASSASRRRSSGASRRACCG